jgi:pimeloyl-ACP methyl ester carboxylesterase
MYFAAQGFTSYALSLRGHGGSGSPKQLHTVCMADYLDDVLQAVERINEPMILVGHSMGAQLVVEAAARRPECIKAVVLLAAGVIGADARPKSGAPFLQVLTTDKRILLACTAASLRVKFSGALHEPFRSPSMARLAFFSPWLDESMLRTYFKNMQPESPLVVDEMVGGTFKSRLDQVVAPAVVVGAGGDQMVSSAAVKEAANRLHTEALFCAGGHDVMLDYAWEQAADRTLAQLIHRGVVSRN